MQNNIELYKYDLQTSSKEIDLLERNEGYIHLSIVMNLTNFPVTGFLPALDAA